MASILLVEDDEQLRQMLKLILTGSGYEVSEAPDGTGVCEMYQKQRFDLVITDLRPGQTLRPATQRTFAARQQVNIEGNAFFARLWHRPC